MSKNADQATLNDRQRLSQYVERRKQELNLITYSEVQERGGPSGPTQTAILHSKPVGDASLRKMDEALSWQSGSCNRILDNQEPIPLDDEGHDTGVINGVRIPDMNIAQLQNAKMEIEINLSELFALQGELSVVVARRAVRERIDEYRRQHPGLNLPLCILLEENPKFRLLTSPGVALPVLAADGTTLYFVDD